MTNAGWLGGDVSMAERHRLRDKYLKPIAHKAIHVGWRDQCRCGSLDWVKWRGRWYCIRCAKFVRRLNSEQPHPAPGGKGDAT